MTKGYIYPNTKWYLSMWDKKKTTRENARILGISTIWAYQLSHRYNLKKKLEVGHGEGRPIKPLWTNHRDL